MACVDGLVGGCTTYLYLLPVPARSSLRVSICFACPCSALVALPVLEVHRVQFLLVALCLLKATDFVVTVRSCLSLPAPGSTVPICFACPCPAQVLL
jgi:hypothetical protein